MQSSPRSRWTGHAPVAPVWELLIGGRVIGTTQEHPIYAWEKGWVPARELAAGDTLLCEDGVWRCVDGVRDTGEVQTVYNLRVADFHTYFVGAEEWGFSVWAHNLSCAETNRIVREVMIDEGVTPNPNGIGAAALRPGIRAEWSNRTYLVEHLIARIGEKYSVNRLQPSDVNTIANLAATRLLEAERRDPQTASFDAVAITPEDAKYVPSGSAVPAGLAGIAHRQYTINSSPNRADALRPIVLNLNHGGWDTDLTVQLQARGLTKSAKGLYVLRNPTTGLIYKVGKADSGGLIGRLEWYAKRWVTRGVKVQVEAYSVSASGRTLFDAERVLRNQVLGDGWALASDGTTDEVLPQGTSGWNAGVIP